MKVLLIEDSKIIAPALIGHLRLKGLECIWAQDGVQGIDKAKREKPDLILLDLMLPKISGFQVCQTLKTDNATWKIPIVIMSTLTSQDQKDKAMEAGADHFIDKPYSMKETVEEIMKFLPKK
ncbi:two-component system [Parelusimicrobium proximum]|uniref:response regulator transcription factor n=1 Tax=Parelusimicrobium proximum TaxID=3228953 RepID=UPI003D16AE2D